MRELSLGIFLVGNEIYLSFYHLNSQHKSEYSIFTYHSSKKMILLQLLLVYRSSLAAFDGFKASSLKEKRFEESYDQESVVLKENTEEKLDNEQFVNESHFDNSVTLTKTSSSTTITSTTQRNTTTTIGRTKEARSIS